MEMDKREDDYCIECSEDGVKYKQMRICHMYKATDEIQFGIYACSPEESSFKAIFPGSINVRSAPNRGKERPRTGRFTERREGI